MSEICSECHRIIIFILAISSIGIALQNNTTFFTCNVNQLVHYPNYDPDEEL